MMMRNRVIILLCILFLSFVNVKSQGENETVTTTGKSEEKSSTPTERKDDCLGERHPSFVLSTDINREFVGGNVTQDSDEFRINRYYAVIRDRFYIKNTGTSLEVQLDLDRPEAKARIRGSGWKDEYVLSKAVFHWQLKNLTVKNPDGTTTFNTKASDPPLEMELVHYAKKHGTLEKAAKERHGILVTGHLFELVGRDNPALEPVARSALSVTFPNDHFKQVHGPLDIKSLFPSELRHYEFNGMYPLSPCETEARFLVFTSPLFVSARQLKRFGALRTEDGQKISDRNFMKPRTRVEIQMTKKGVSNVFLSIVRKLDLPARGSITSQIPGWYTRIFQIISILHVSCLL